MPSCSYLPRVFVERNHALIAHKRDRAAARETRTVPRQNKQQMYSMVGYHPAPRLAFVVKDLTSMSRKTRYTPPTPRPNPPLPSPACGLRNDLPGDPRWGRRRMVPGTNFKHGWVRCKGNHCTQLGSAGDSGIRYPDVQSRLRRGDIIVLRLYGGHDHDACAM